MCFSENKVFSLQKSKETTMLSTRLCGTISLEPRNTGSQKGLAPKRHRPINQCHFGYRGSRCMFVGEHSTQFSSVVTSLP